MEVTKIILVHLVKGIYMKNLLLLLVLFVLSACMEKDPPILPLSKYELDRLIIMTNKIIEKEKEYENYLVEKERIRNLEGDYLKESVELADFIVYETSNFNDGRARVCYKGYLINSGPEIIEKIDIEFNFFSKVTEKLEYVNKSSLISADYENEGSSFSSFNNSASQRKLPLRPHSILKLSGNCIKKVILNLNLDDTIYKLSGLKLQTKLVRIEASELLKLRVEISDLEVRAMKFKQY